MSTGLAVFTLFHVALSVVGILAGFVVVFELFSAKQSKLKVLAPTQSEPPFLAIPIVLMLSFILLGVLATKRFPAQPVHAS